jgi:GH18 family chitinase
MKANLLIFIIFFSSLFAQAQRQYLSVGYIPNWSYSCYTTLDYGALTHLNIAFCNPNTSGDLSAGISDANLRAIIAKAHQNEVKVMASLGGAGYSNNYPALISTAAARTAFCNKIIAYARNYGFDGVDLDIEGEAADAFWTYYEAWVQELRTKCTENDLLLTTAVGQWYGNKITNPTLTYFDFVTIMEYDLKANNYQGRINYWLNTKGVPANKLVLGVPFYGYKSGNYLAYKDILAANPDAWYVNHFEDYTYHNPADIAAIAQLSKNYYGIMIWELSQDVLGDYSLLKAVKNVLYENGTGIPPIAVPIENIVLSPAILTLTQGRLGQFDAVFTPENSTLKTLTWTTAQTNRISVDSRGAIKGLTIGNAQVTATSIDGAHSVNAMVRVVADTSTNGFFPDDYHFVSVYSNKVMEITNNSHTVGAALQQGMLSPNNYIFQRWKFEYVSDNKYYIKSMYSGYYLTAMGEANGSDVLLQAFTGESNQQWQMTEILPGVFSVINVYVEKALDVSGPSVADGAKVHLWTYSNGKNQQWLIDKVKIETGLKNRTKGGNFSAGYNTADKQIIVASASMPKGVYRLYGVSGNLQKTGELNNFPAAIDASDLQAGIYLFCFKVNDESVLRTKILISKFSE